MFSDYSEFGPVLLGGSERKLHASFRLKNSNVTLANTLRRAILVQTPSVAFRTEPYDKSDVVITINTTPLVNEMIAHRIGMIPIRANPMTFQSNLYEFVLDVENASKVVRDVRASDFKVFMRNSENMLDAPTELVAADFFPPDPITGDTVLITRLRPQWNPTAPNERIQLRAKATVSTGTENIRWSPVSQCSYGYTRDPDPEHCNAVFVDWLEKSKKISDPATLPGERREELQREFNTMEIQRCYLTDGRGEPNDFTFQLESVGILAIPDVVKAGIAACEAMVTRYQDVDGTIPASVRVQQGDSRFPTIDVYFQNETHSLGNLLETCINDNFMDGKEEPRVTYVGYTVPHPLRPEMFVRIGVNPDITDPDMRMQSARLVIASACRKLKSEFRSLSAAWDAQFTGAEAETAATEA